MAHHGFTYTTDKLTADITVIPDDHYAILRETTDFDPLVEGNITRVADDQWGKAQWHTIMATRRRAYYLTLPLEEGVRDIPPEHLPLAIEAGYIKERDGDLFRVEDEDGVALWRSCPDLGEEDCDVAGYYMPPRRVADEHVSARGSPAPRAAVNASATAPTRQIRIPSRKRKRQTVVAVPPPTQADDNEDRRVRKPTKKVKAAQLDIDADDTPNDTLAKTRTYTLNTSKRGQALPQTLTGKRQTVDAAPQPTRADGRQTGRVRKPTEKAKAARFDGDTKENPQPTPAKTKTPKRKPVTTANSDVEDVKLTCLFTDCNRRIPRPNVRCTDVVTHLKDHHGLTGLSVRRHGGNMAELKSEQDAIIYPWLVSQGVNADETIFAGGAGGEESSSSDGEEDGEETLADENEMDEDGDNIVVASARTKRMTR
ncbi:hypothetical protein LTR08_005404 [Meristemomyces frigidus]|nr:hypothetical protein LTR08_005404 [Meristemomyces frigidus]